MWTRSELKDRAKEIMRTCYWKVFLICLLAALLGATSGSGASSSGFNFSTDIGVTYQFHIGPFKYNYPLALNSLFASLFVVGFVLLAVAAAILLNMFVINILRVGFCRYLVLTQQNRESVPASELLWGFRCGHYMNLVKTMFLYDLYLFLWSLLLIIPGIIKGYEYFCVPYILAENPQLDSSQVFAMSKEMTSNQKWDMFVLNLSFLGWEILGALLFGIGTYFVLPYIELTNGELYAVLRQPVNPGSGRYDSYDSYTYYER